MNLKGVNKSTWVRIIALFLVLINQISISFFNFELVPFGEEQIYEGVSIILTTFVTVWTTWKDNDITSKAQNNTKILKERGLK